MNSASRRHEWICVLHMSRRACARVATSFAVCTRGLEIPCFGLPLFPSREQHFWLGSFVSTREWALCVLDLGMDSIDLDAEDLFGDDDEDDIEAALIKEDARADSDADADAADGQRDAGPEEDEELDVAVLRALDPSRTRGGARKRTASTRSRNLLDPVRLLGPRGLRSLLESARRVSGKLLAVVYP